MFIHICFQSYLSRHVLRKAYYGSKTFFISRLRIYSELIKVTVFRGRSVTNVLGNNKTCFIITEKKYRDREIIALNPVPN